METFACVRKHALAPAETVIGNVVVGEMARALVGHNALMASAARRWR